MTERKKSAKKRPRPDYFEFSLDVKHSKFVTDYFTKSRRICIRGLGVFVQIEGNKRPEFGMSYPAFEPLCRLVKAHPEANDFSWDRKSKKWKLTRYGSLCPGEVIRPAYATQTQLPHHITISDLEAGIAREVGQKVRKKGMSR